MFVVRRPFRNLGKILTAGTVISDPAVIKHFKSRLAEGKIIKVDEHNFKSCYDFFKQKFGVELPKLSNANSESEVALEVSSTDKSDIKPAVSKASVVASTKVVAKAK